MSQTTNDATSSLDQPLTAEQAKAFNQILRSAPGVGLTEKGGWAPKTMREVLAAMEGLSAALTKYIQETMKLREEAEKTEADLQAAGRIFKRMGIGE